ncbi:TPA: DUF4238 domain-containing protein [Vibrio parahaemolyticus]|uniref:DUF4238 domain-containing protein n=1 Tax=Vibrio parahaemolyticus TaxID=670 RepID=UPI0005F1E898|nr:DUF4238 domain-containing protein [Vibrio parahaemolyticus]EGR1737988.1 DUF4238 domain-containing protein [Vibrio parahaemolyticus]EHK9087810.1 DUF4238 domain-containing protein [Vibrio parahaemolyticus]EHZ2783795.1 DUF4238 domain-containing protein [Vibrio parahaemolyticus]EKA7366023.1 DUF4238 domain-containing protein [Vibrio parahaemolyticus]EKK9975576.1 DUF4238 domain-containing protein [Vibrio parahaemolyticus]
MAKKKPLSHYVPKFSNKYWADESNFVSYFWCEFSSSVKKGIKGKKQWGRERGLYSWAVEHALDKELETKVAPLYEKLITYNELSKDERFLWAQFILSQLVRTPSYIEYEKRAVELTGVESQPMCDRVGCQECLDLSYVANRNWLLLKTHADDYLVRTDNPVLQTGFIELPSSYLIYPLTPHLCFVATPMNDSWSPFEHNNNPIMGYQMAKGWAHMVNFYLAKSAYRSLVLSPEHAGVISDTMFTDVLGSYTQPPFSLHVVENELATSAFESIRQIMSIVDGFDYPTWEIERLTPDYPEKTIA